MIAGPSTPGDEAGFTLAEMLVSLALLAVAAALMIEGFGASRGAWRRMQAREEAGESVAAAETRLRTALEQMVVRARFETSVPYVDLDGDDAHFVFASAPPAGEPPGTTAPTELSLTSGGDLQLAPAASEAAGRAEVLLKGAASLEIGYYTGGANAGWRDAWSREPTPPQLVRVRVAFPPGDRRVWPDLIVRPAATVDVQCVVDGDTGSCRGRA